MSHASSTTSASIAVLTVSDTRSLEDDYSGAIIVEAFKAVGHTIANHAVVTDEQEEIKMIVHRWSCDAAIQAIIVSGGTGVSPRDVTPDAIVPMMTSILPGFGELFRQLSFEEIGTASILSRATAGWIDVDAIRTPIFLLPGSPKAVALAVSKLILPQLSHLVDLCGMESLQ